MAYPIDELVGSYAGAMGWGQFIPTSVANYAVDYDGDGRIDLWNSLADIVGSVANYFSADGFEDSRAAGCDSGYFGRQCAQDRNQWPDAESTD